MKYRHYSPRAPVHIFEGAAALAAAVRLHLEGGGGGEPVGGGAGSGETGGGGAGGRAPGLGVMAAGDVLRRFPQVCLPLWEPFVLHRKHCALAASSDESSGCDVDAAGVASGWLPSAAMVEDGRRDRGRVRCNRLPSTVAAAPIVAARLEGPLHPAVLEQVVDDPRVGGVVRSLEQPQHEAAPVQPCLRPPPPRALYSCTPPALVPT